MHVLNIILLLCGFIAAALAELEPESKLGPKMCEQLCNKRLDCFEYQFDASDLSCQLNKAEFDKSSGSGKFTFNITKNKNRLYAEDKLKCRKNSILFRSRRNLPVCDDCLSKQTKKLAAKGLLVFPKGKNREGMQVLLSNDTDIKNPYCKEGGVLAAVNLHPVKYLFFSIKTDILSVDVDTNTQSPMHIDKSILPILGFAVDPRKSLLFMISKPIGIFPFNGGDLKPFKNKIEAKQIAVDTERKMIYATVTNESLAKYTYDGKFIHMFSDEQFREQIDIDSESSFLYYVTGSNELKRMSLSRNNKREVIQAHFRATFLKIINDKVYAYENDQILISNFGNSTRGSKIKTIKSHYPPNQCLIPVVYYNYN